jgi:hypothetical protein
MRKPVTVVVALAACAVLGIAAIQAIGAPSHPRAATHAPATHAVAATPAAATPAARPAAVKVVMRDPGCHWFAVGSKLKTRLAVSGMAKLSNFDEAALRIKSHGAVKRVRVGRTTALGRGAYTITMVGQKSDDNTLHLTVR